ncbi:hypothetical protein GCM10010298_68750 [Streptomyces microflavus]|nr:hypothetical protein GCM10010298_68750 [Streptomyces microflavus]
MNTLSEIKNRSVDDVSMRARATHSSPPRHPATPRVPTHSVSRWPIAATYAVSVPDGEAIVSLLRFDGHHWCGGQAASAVSYSAGLR